MLVRLCKNTFIRHYDGEGYITNQMTRHDRSYNETGNDFLKEITRQPQEVDDILNRLSDLYGDSVSKEELKKDFIDFIQDLADHFFLVVGDSPEELDAKDIDFSYAMENPKTLVDDYTQETVQRVDENTQDHNLEAAQRKPRLNAIQFELTSRCNERCIHCYIPNAKKNTGKDMPIEKVFSIIDEFADMGGLHVTLSGGEVFMHKDVIRIMQYCREKDMMISILSNLIALKDVQIPFIKAANVSIIQTSLYSMDPAIHDSITTVKGSFVKTKAAIEKLVAADIPVQISCPLMKANFKGYADVLKYAQSLRCKAQTDYIMMAQSNLDTQNLANRLSLEETELVLRDIMKWDVDYKDDTLKHQLFSEDNEISSERFFNQPLCGAGINDCCIAENGDVYPCAGWQDMTCGNVYQQSLREIWETSQEFNDLREIRRSDFKDCLKCEAMSFCAMCLVRNYNESGGDMFKINRHFCDVAFLNKSIVEECYNETIMSNYSIEFVGKYVAILSKTMTGNYADNSEYHCLLDAYDAMMRLIENEIDISAVKMALTVFNEALEKVQRNVQNAWTRVFPDNDYPRQRSIHGLNIIISKILEKIAETEKL